MRPCDSWKVPPGWFAVSAPMLREHYTTVWSKNQAFIGWNDDLELCGDMRDDGGGKCAVTRRTLPGFDMPGCQSGNRGSCLRVKLAQVPGGYRHAR